MAPPFASLTKTWHSKAYPAIDPTRPELSAKDKTIVVTGGGGSIGTAIALSFARAGAQKIAVVGRRESPLNETKKTVEGQVKDVRILVVTGGIASEASMQESFAKIYHEFGKITVLVANAGYLSKFEPVLEAEPEEWWTGFEINTRGAFNVSRAFIPVAAADAVLVDISTCVVHLPAMASASSYVASKLAATKIYETVGAENQNIAVMHVHPGVVYSELNVKSGITALDEADLPGCFVVWVTSAEAKFLTGKYVWCNWDVDELRSRKEELQRPDQLTITMNGWPFGPTVETDALGR